MRMPSCIAPIYPYTGSSAGTPALLRQMVPVLLCAVISGAAVAQQDYPNRPVRIVVPFPPGGSTDPMARLIASKLSERWNGINVVVDNRPGGNTIIGTSLVAKSSPDGYTMGYCGSSLFSAPNLIPHLPYDATKDLVGVSGVAKSRTVLVVHPSVPAHTLKELIELAKTHPGDLNYGSSGIGTTTHLSGELFKIVTGAKILHVPYKGSGPLTTDLLGGRVKMSFQISITQIPNIVAGRVRALAVTGEERLKALPDIPTFTEAGLPGFGVSSWTCLIAPAGTPMAVRKKVADTLDQILRAQDTLDLFTKLGMEPFPLGPEAANELIKTDIKRYGKIIKDANITWHP
jgi:tripartite-type tricarboxylate transporter receptor subunit TctC